MVVTRYILLILLSTIATTAVSQISIEPFCQGRISGQFASRLLDRIKTIYRTFPWVSRVGSAINSQRKVCCRSLQFQS